MPARGYRTINVPTEVYDRLDARREALGLTWGDFEERLCIVEEASGADQSKPNPAGAVTGLALDTRQQDEAEVEDDFLGPVSDPAPKAGEVEVWELADIVAARVEALVPSPEAVGHLGTEVEGLRGQLQAVAEGQQAVSGRQVETEGRIATLQERIEGIASMVARLEEQVRYSRTEVRDILYPRKRTVASFMAQANPP